MNTSKRLVEMIFNEKNDQFKTVIEQELKHRAAILMEKMYKNESKKVLNFITNEKKKENTTDNKKEKIVAEHTFFQKTYKLKDGNVGILSEQDQKNMSELYKNLNNHNKERMVKLLSESQETFNRVLNLARLENKKQGTKNE